MKAQLKKLNVVATAVVGLEILIEVLRTTQAVETKLLFLTATTPKAALLFGT